MVMQGKEPELHNEQLEAAVQEFKKDQTNENMVKIMLLLEKACVMQPAFLPAGNKEDIQRLMKQGQAGKAPLVLSPQMQPRPVILKNDKGEQFFGVFTGKAQIPQKQKYQAMLFVPFRECSKMAARKELQLKGIVLNPFTDNLTLHMAALELMNNKLEKQGAPVKVPPADIIMQVKLPERFHQDRKGFMQEIVQGKEEAVAGIFREAYQKIAGEGAKCPYQAADFEVMALNISETLQMVRIGFPESSAVKGQYLSGFCFFGPKTGDGIVYLVRRGAKGSPNLLCAVDEKGVCTELGEAPSEGSELYELIGRVPWENENP